MKGSSLPGYCGKTRELAFRIALRFPTFVPSARQIMDAFPEVKKDTAARCVREYRRAWKGRVAA